MHHVYKSRQQTTQGDNNKQTIIHEIRYKLGQLEDNVKAFCNFYKGYTHQSQIASGAVYIRWGRSTCPGNGTQLMYSGFAGGAKYNIGGAANYLCRSKDPTWRKYKDGVQRGGQGAVYGSEYETDCTIVKLRLVNQEVPCAVCQSSKRSSVYMIPGRDSCYGNWHLEYSGYLMSDRINHKSSEYVCLDADPDPAKDTSSKDEDGHLFYPVEARCGSLKCPPYVKGRELTCAVCTK